MTMVVKNNIAAQLVLGELNKNQLKLGKSLEKVSSGEKFKSAKNNASGYVISEKMREQIRTLAQDNQNVQNGSSLFKIASGGVDNIVEELRNLKELAINAANDTNTDIDRKTIQKEFLQKMANINDIATMTNYNGKTLLDGTYKRPINEINEVEPTIIYDDGYNIDSDGIYVLARGFTGTVNVNAQNVKITQEDSTTVLKNVQILGRSDGNSNLWIEDLNIENNVDLSVIKFQGADNVLSVKGDNTLSIFKEDSVSIKWGSATINVGESLTITGDSSSLNVSNHSTAGPGLGSISDARGAGIGGDLNETTAGDIIIGGSVTISVATENGAGIGSAGGLATADSLNDPL